MHEHEEHAHTNIGETTQDTEVAYTTATEATELANKIGELCDGYKPNDITLALAGMIKALAEQFSHHSGIPTQIASMVILSRIKDFLTDESGGKVEIKSLDENEAQHEAPTTEQ